MRTHFLICLSMCLAFASAAFAHRPYEASMGTFKRSDGAVVSMAAVYFDGLIGNDPLSVYFRLSDGSSITNTPFGMDTVVERRDSSVDVYLFSGTWYPVASHVSHFDGFTMTDVTAAQRSHSVIAHTVGHWIGYLEALGFAAALFVVARFLHSLPLQKTSVVISRIIGLMAVYLMAALFVLGILLFGPLSPVVLVVLGGIGAVVYFPLRMAVRRNRRANAKPVPPVIGI